MATYSEHEQRQLDIASGLELDRVSEANAASLATMGPLLGALRASDPPNARLLIARKILSFQRLSAQEIAAQLGIKPDQTSLIVQLEVCLSVEWHRGYSAGHEAAPDLLAALNLILPLAKGYAAAHPVGSNAAYVAQAEAALARAEGR